MIIILELCIDSFFYFLFFYYFFFQRKSFEEALIYNFNEVSPFFVQFLILVLIFYQILEAFATIDAETSEAWSENDRDMIFSAVRSSDGSLIVFFLSHF